MFFFCSFLCCWHGLHRQQQPRQAETRARELARDIKTLTQWLRHDVLALAGPALATRHVLFNFIVEELAHREPRDLRRIRPVRVALQNQRYALLAFAGVLDGKLAAIAHTHAIAEPLVREACLLHHFPAFVVPRVAGSRLALLGQRIADRHRS